MNVKSIFNFFIMLEGLEKRIELINRNQKVKDIVILIDAQDIFLFTYNVRNASNINANDQDFRYEVD